MIAAMSGSGPDAGDTPGAAGDAVRTHAVLRSEELGDIPRNAQRPHQLCEREQQEAQQGRHFDPGGMPVQPADHRRERRHDDEAFPESGRVSADDDIEEIRVKGSGTSRHELIEGAVAVAAPFFNGANQVAGSALTHHQRCLYRIDEG
ncbi:IclR family transcriptional regulator [Paraburkholderia rhynchosiae]|uniref:hypothetical protein n=1 Tax=Paraburkholderia rhynchosiae TaxID=487049 RepID=UPI001FC8EC69|nr:hypothetical protein [Paraburkholderia rhynchosiae]